MFSSQQRSLVTEGSSRSSEDLWWQKEVHILAKIFDDRRKFSFSFLTKVFDDKSHLSKALWWAKEVMFCVRDLAFTCVSVISPLSDTCTDYNLQTNPDPKPRAPTMVGGTFQTSLFVSLDLLSLSPRTSTPQAKGAGPRSDQSRIAVQGAGSRPLVPRTAVHLSCKWRSHNQLE